MISDYKRTVRAMRYIGDAIERKHNKLCPATHYPPTKRSNEIAKKRIQRQLDLDPRFNIDESI